MRQSCKLVVALVAGLAGPVRADVIYDNFGPGNTYGNVAWVIGNNGIDRLVQGDPFTVRGGSFTLDVLTLPLAHRSGPNAIDVILMTDADGRPAAVLEAFHLINLREFPRTGPPDIATSVLHPLLQEGAQYWVIAAASGDSQMLWNWNSTGDTGPHAQMVNGGDWNIINGTRGAFRVEGEPVPEPGTFALLGIGTLGIIGCAYRHRKFVA